MEIHRVDSSNSTTYQLSGRFDAHQVDKVRSEVQDFQQNIVIDMSEVSFIDSSGLATLVNIFKKSRQENVELSICNIQDSVKLILEITQLYNVLPIH